MSEFKNKMTLAKADLKPVLAELSEELAGDAAAMEKIRAIKLILDNGT